MTEPAASEPQPDHVSAEPLPSVTGPSRDLTGWERSGAGVIGVAGTIVGGVGIFLSDNQAGTAVILLLGVIFLLMAVQGTAVRRLTRDGGDFAERAAAERRAVDEIQQTYEDEGPKAAQAALEGATAARPELAQSPALGVINAQLHEREVIDAVRVAWRNVIHERYGDEVHFIWTSTDEEVAPSVDALFGVEGLDGPFKPQMAVEVLPMPIGYGLTERRLINRIGRMNKYKLPYLVVSSARPTAAALQAWKYSPRPVARQLVRWETGDPLEAIEHAIETLIGQSAGEIPMDTD